MGTSCVFALALLTGSFSANAIDIRSGEIQDGLRILNGGGDVVNVFGSIAVETNGYFGTVTGGSPEYTGADENIFGILVTGQLIGLSAEGVQSTQIDAPIVRWWFRLENPNPGAVSVLVTFPGFGNLGSDQDTEINATSSGDPFLTSADIWSVTSDGNDGLVDPAIAFAFSSASAPLAPSGADLVNDDQYVISYAGVSIPANSSISFVYFAASRSFTGPLPTGRSTVAQATALVEGIYAADGRVRQAFVDTDAFGPLSEIQNIAFVAAPTPNPTATPSVTPSPAPPKAIKLSVRGKSKVTTGRSSIVIRGKLTGGLGKSVVKIKVRKGRSKKVKVASNGNWKTKIQIPRGKTRLMITGVVGGKKAKSTELRVTRK